MSENNNKREYKYDAFISYRHTEPDKFVAEKIQKYLEEFKLPKNVKNRDKLRKTKIERVFRDKEELTITNNLEDPIIQALKDSEYLIVICSPRTKESIWCLKEIEKFTEFHGRNKILTVLIEGEPSDSFPDSLLYEDVVVEENGVSTVQRKEIEPLAADVRGKSKRQMCALIKTELLRVIAPMFGLEYDDLRQRHRERRMKKILTATVSAAALGITIGIAGIAAALVINNQKNEISSQQEKLLDYQAVSLADEAEEYLAEDRRCDAIKSALSSVTEFEGIKMPYTAKGRYALTQALRVYDAGRVYKAQNQFFAKTNIYSIKLSPSRGYVMAIDKAKNIYVWDTAGDLAVQIDDFYDETYTENYVSFVGDSMIAYLNNKNEIKVVDYVEGKDVLSVSDIEYASSVVGDEEGKYFAVIYSDKIEIYDVASGSSVYNQEIKAEESIDYNPVWCGEKIYFVSEVSDLEEDGGLLENFIWIIDVNTQKTTKIDGNFNMINGVRSTDDYTYIMAGRFGGLSDEEFGTILAVDENSGELVWQKKYADIPISKMECVESNGETYVIASSYSDIYCIDGKTGNEIYRETATDGIADWLIGTDGSMEIIDIKGNLIGYNVFSREGYGLDYLLECNVGKIDNIKICKDGYILLPMVCDYIIKYEKTADTHREPIEVNDKIIEASSTLLQSYDEYNTDSENLDLDNPEMVSNILYTDDEKVAFITYLDMTMEIYDVSNKKIINTLQEMKSVPVKNFGKDKEGNIYIAGENCGYCFDKEYNLIAEIDKMIYADMSEEYVVVGDINGELWKIPIYSLNKLIKIAKN